MNEHEIEFPAREDPAEEPAEPWARPDGETPDWETIQQQVEEADDGADQEMDR